MGTKLKPRRLTDASVAKLVLAKTAAGYFCRDDILPGFSIRVGLTRRTWRYDHEHRDESGRRHQISVKLGEFKPGEPGHVDADEARAKVPTTPEQRRALANREDDARMTLATAFGKYKELMIKKGRSQRTIEDYTFKFERHLTRWHSTPLGAIRRADVEKTHGELTARVGPYVANGVMRVAHAVYAFAVKDLELPDLPTLNPFRSRNLFNKETPRKNAVGSRTAGEWFKELLALDNGVRREMHWMTYLSGLRRRTVTALAWRDVSIRNRVAFIRFPKGGEDRAFSIPLSRAMVHCLCRARIAGRQIHGVRARIWVFPSATSESGHVEEIKERRLSTVGHGLRRSYRTAHGARGTDRLRTKLLLNHQIDRDITDSYASPDEMFDELREAQEAVSEFIIKNVSSNADAQLTARLAISLSHDPINRSSKLGGNLRVGIYSG
jgi:integrase